MNTCSQKILTPSTPELIPERQKWQELPTVKLGDLGERLVRDYLTSKGYIPYQTHHDGAHPFDLMVAAPDKTRIFIADIKTKCSRFCYPDTGIQKKHFDEYTYLMEHHKIDVFLFFVDSCESRVYGNFLSVLSRDNQIFHRGREITYPLEEGRIIYFPTSSMKHITTLTAEQCQELEGLSNRSYVYEAAK